MSFNKILHDTKYINNWNHLRRGMNEEKEWNSLNSPFKSKRLSVQFSSVTHLHLSLCEPMDCSTPVFLVHHQLPEFTQTHVHWVSGAIQPSHPLLFPSSAFNFSQHQGFFKWVSPSNQVAKVLEFQLQHQSFQYSSEYSGLISFRMDWFDLFAVQQALKSLPIPQFKSINSLVFSFLYSPTLASIHDYWKNHSFD